MTTIQNNADLFMNTGKDVNSNNITENKTKENSLLRETVGVVAGAGAGYCVNKGVNLALKPYYKNLKSSLDTFHNNSNIMIQEAERMANEAGIYKKGFKGIRIFTNETEIKQAINAITDEFIKTKAYLVKNFLDIPYLLIGRKKSFKSEITSAMTYGCFNCHSNMVRTGKTASLLHEVGHAINKNKNFLTAMPAKFAATSMVLLTPMAILTALFHKKDNSKTPDKKSLLEKTEDFVKDHPGLTIAGLALPQLFEEGMASLRAVKFAKTSTLMTEAMKKAHSKMLLRAFGTYIAGAATLTAAAKTAFWVKDKVTEEK